MPPVRIGSVVIDCNDFETMWAFWRDALGFVPREEPEPGWGVLRDPNDPLRQISLQKVPEPRVGKNRLHLDLYTTEQASEIERILALGATRFDREAEPDEDFVVLEDPEGNLFCVIQHADRASLSCRTDGTG